MSKLLFCKLEPNNKLPNSVCVGVGVGVRGRMCGLRQICVNKIICIPCFFFLPIITCFALLISWINIQPGMVIWYHTYYQTFLNFWHLFNLWVQIKHFTILYSLMTKLPEFWTPLHTTYYITICIRDIQCPLFELVSADTTGTLFNTHTY